MCNAEDKKEEVKARMLKGIVNNNKLSKDTELLQGIHRIAAAHTYCAHTRRESKRDPEERGK